MSALRRRLDLQTMDHVARTGFPAASSIRAIPMNTPTLIDQFLPVFDFSERHSINIHASIEEVFSVVRSLNFTPSVLTRIMFRLRGLPRVATSLSGLQEMGFVFLGERAPVEMALGIVGKFWTVSGCIQSLTADSFRSFQTPGYAKAVWSFSISEIQPGLTQATTETRVLCLDKVSLNRFRFYWVLVRPFSGFIRKRILVALKDQAQRQKSRRS